MIDIKLLKAYSKIVHWEKVKKLNKNIVIITQDVIEDCLCESLDVLEKNNSLHSKFKKVEPLKSRTLKK